MFTWSRFFTRAVPVALLCGVVSLACTRNPPPEAPDTPELPPSVLDNVPEPPPPPVEPEPPPPPPSPPVLEPEEDLVTRSLEELNQDSPLMPVFFGYDSSEIDTESRRVLDENAEVLRGNPNWVVTIEGHCDERGTAEYNLALGERRAVAARDYLVNLGLPGNRLRTVSYGKEFPFDPGHDETAWRANRRAHLVITEQ
ncbi:MAG: peptidoglycan-associated lipoprotein Pal [Acidobacteria bacterium]|nr:peptidoglycan-associated lipoprotein Pal [Acidobacteriota bacterium]